MTHPNKQCSAIVEDLKRSNTINTLKTIFSTPELQNVITEEVPHFRNRVFPPSDDLICIHVANIVF
jgi:hypothetical protein